MTPSIQTPSIETPIPKRVGPYRIRGRLGQGLHWQVLEGSHDQLKNRRVAIKVPRFQGELTPLHAAVWTTFLKEEGSRLTKLKNDPHVVHVHDFGMFEYGGHELPYLAMEIVDNGTLHDYLRRTGEALSPATALAIGIQIAAGLGAIHTAKLTHRDLKPDNVLLEHRPSLAGTFTVKLTDLSLTSMGLTTSQSRSLKEWRLQDVSDCCRWLYQMLAGEPPMPEGAVRLPECMRRKIARPHQLEWILSVGLGRDPQTRFADGNTLHNALRAYRDGRAPSGCRVGRWERVRMWSRRNPVVAGLGVALLVAIMLGGGAVFLQQSRVEQARQHGESLNQQFTDLDKSRNESFIREAIQRSRERTANNRIAGAPDQARLERMAALRADVGRLKEQLSARTRHPENEIALRICDAIALWADGKFDDSLAAADPALLDRLSPDHPVRPFLTYHLHRIRGSVLVAQLKWRDAADSFAQAARAEPNSWVAHALRGLCELNARDYPAANESYGKAIAVLRTAEAAGEKLLTDPLRAELFGHAGRLLIRADRPGDAVPLLSESVAAWRAAGRPARHDYAAVLIELGTANWKLGRPDEAERYLEEGIPLGEPLPEMQPKGIDAEVLSAGYRNRADARTARRQHVAALRDLDLATARLRLCAGCNDDLGAVLNARAWARLAWIQLGVKSRFTLTLSAVGGGVTFTAGPPLAELNQLTESLRAATKDANEAVAIFSRPEHSALRADALSARAFGEFFLEDLDAADRDANAALALYRGQAPNPATRAKTDLAMKRLLGLTQDIRKRREQLNADR